MLQPWERLVAREDDWVAAFLLELEPGDLAAGYQRSSWIASPRVRERPRVLGRLGVLGAGPLSEHFPLPDQSGERGLRFGVADFTDQQVKLSAGSHQAPNVTPTHGGTVVAVGGWVRDLSACGVRGRGEHSRYPTRALGREDAGVDHCPKGGCMQSVPLLDCAGRRRSPATLASFHAGRPPRNKGLRYPPDPPTVEEIIAVMGAAGDDPDGLRLRGLIVALWRTGLRISEALALVETDLDPPRGAILVRNGKAASGARSA
jgi:hypothetical protein